MATAGLAGLLALTGEAGARSVDGGSRLLLAGLGAGAVALLYGAARGVRRPVARGVLLAGGAGVAFGVASVFTKTVAVDLMARDAPVPWPSLSAIAALAAAGLLLSQAAYRGAGLTAPLATVTVTNPVVAAAVGLTLFGEGFRYGVPGTVLALGCGVLAAGGLILLTAVPPEPERARAQPPSQTHAAGPQVGEGVDVGPVPRPRSHLEVEVRSGAVAGGS
jgi:hypothetical protein